jgi:hypothetical protein
LESELRARSAAHELAATPGASCSATPERECEGERKADSAARIVSVPVPSLARFSALSACHQGAPPSSSSSSSSSSSAPVSLCPFKFVVTLSEGMAKGAFALGNAVVVAQRFPGAFPGDTSAAATEWPSATDRPSASELAALSAQVREFIEGLPDLLSMLQ